MNATQIAREREGQKMNVNQLIESYLRSSQVQGKTKATLKWYQRRLGHFAKFLVANSHSMLIRDLNRDDGERYVMGLMQQDTKWAEHPNQKPMKGELSKHTIHGHVRAVRALTNWALIQGLLMDDPFASMPVPKLPKLLYEILAQ